MLSVIQLKEKIKKFKCDPSTPIDICLYPGEEDGSMNSLGCNGMYLTNTNLIFSNCRDIKKWSKAQPLRSIFVSGTERIQIKDLLRYFKYIENGEVGSVELLILSENIIDDTGESVFIKYDVADAYVVDSILYLEGSYRWES